MSWSQAFADMDAELLDEYGERVRHVPTKRAVNARVEADPAKAAYELTGIFEWQQLRLEILKGETGTKALPAAFHSSRNPVLGVRREALQYEVQEGDIFELVDRGLAFEVIDPQPDGTGWVFIQLNQRGRHIQAGLAP